VTTSSPFIRTTYAYHPVKRDGAAGVGNRAEDVLLRIEPRLSRNRLQGFSFNAVSRGDNGSFTDRVNVAAEAKAA